MDSELIIVLTILVCFTLLWIRLELIVEHIQRRIDSALRTAERTHYGQGRSS